ncbi:MAG: hypothetical protein ACLSVU_02580, partial [Christensenellales bacterium]
THTAENHDFISSDQGSRPSTSKPLFRSARSGHKARQCFNRQNALRLSEYAAPVLPMRQKLPS